MIVKLKKIINGYIEKNDLIVHPCVVMNIRI